MASVTSIAASGMRAAQARLDASSHNVANADTAKFRRLEVEQQAQSDSAGVRTQVQRAAERGVSMEQEAVELMAAKSAYGANLQVFRTGDRMLGHLLDERS